jgi:hypothetical protein
VRSCFPCLSTDGPQYRRCAPNRRSVVRERASRYTHSSIEDLEERHPLGRADIESVRPLSLRTRRSRVGAGRTCDMALVPQRFAWGKKGKPMWHRAARVYVLCNSGCKGEEMRCQMSHEEGHDGDVDYIDGHVYGIESLELFTGPLVDELNTLKSLSRSLCNSICISPSSPPALSTVIGEGRSTSLSGRHLRFSCAKPSDTCEVRLGRQQ